MNVRKNQTVRVFAVDLPPEGTRPADGSRLLRIQLPVFDRVLDERVRVADVPARLADMVPLARHLAERILASAVTQLRQRGLTLSCRKGCDACCHYLVPISPPEAFHLWEDLLALQGQHRRRIAESFEKAARNVLSARFTARADDQTELLREVAQWYTSLDQPCPLLNQHGCELHSERPVVCREYNVVSNPALCDGHNPGVATRLELPVSLAECLMELTARVEGREPEGVILSTLLAWLPENLQRHHRTYPAIELAETMLEIVRLRCRTDLDLPRAAPHPEETGDDTAAA
ncbi:MAG: YkgJ family cysteine cluster protein [Phycisphaerae bacterium]